MGSHLRRGAFYGVFLKETNPEMVEKMVFETGAMGEEEWQCLEIENPSNFEPFPQYNLIGIIRDGNGVIGDTRLFVGAKMDGTYAGNMQKIEEIRQQLDDFFSRGTGLEKEGDYALQGLAFYG